MPKHYHHLTHEDRCQIYALKKREIPVALIAEDLGFHRSTIYRELKRNQGGRGYRIKQSNNLAETRRMNASCKPRKLTAMVANYITDLLQNLHLSPDQISGRLSDEHKISISHESIYRFIWRDKATGGCLWTFLRHRAKKYNKRSLSKSGRGFIPNRVDIEHRPAVVDAKSRLGDWEGDTIVGKNHQMAILSHVDRKSKYTKLTLLPDRTATSVLNACSKAFRGMQDKVKTITYDNGKEFSRHEDIARKLGAKIYFAKPYHAWERGLNEHTNGLVRQYFPKGTDFTKLSEIEVQNVEDILNNRPRKVLNYKTPREVFFNCSTPLVALHC